MDDEPGRLGGGEDGHEEEQEEREAHRHGEGAGQARAAPPPSRGPRGVKLTNHLLTEIAMDRRIGREPRGSDAAPHMRYNACAPLQRVDDKNQGRINDKNQDKSAKIAADFRR